VTPRQRALADKDKDLVRSCVRTGWFAGPASEDEEHPVVREAPADGEATVAGWPRAEG
jgi:hypothetical protein